MAENLSHFYRKNQSKMPMSYPFQCAAMGMVVKAEGKWLAFVLIHPENTKGTFKIWVMGQERTANNMCMKESQTNKQTKEKTANFRIPNNDREKEPLFKVSAQSRTATL